MTRTRGPAVTRSACHGSPPRPPSVPGSGSGARPPRGAVDSLVTVQFSKVIWLLGAVVLFFGIWIIGVGILRSMTTPMAEPPPPGELRRVNVRYRCDVCGLEIKLTLAPDEDPPPPRHC